jgi:CelD/BcsL family acetyltransferase involved in cellulose biosynthesis
MGMTTSAPDVLTGAACRERLAGVGAAFTPPVITGRPPTREGSSAAARAPTTSLAAGAGGAMGIFVEAHRTLAALGALEGAVRALDAASVRPSLFNDPAHLARVLAHDEHAAARAEPLLLVAREAGEVVGFLPLRARPAPVLGATRGCLEHLLAHDTERPGLVARPADAPRCAAAFLAHLADREPGWTLLELKEQDAASPLWTAAAGLDPRRFEVRRYANNPSAAIPLPAAGFTAWFHGLDKDQRRKVRGWVTRLSATGPLELVAAAGPAGATALLDLYLSLEARSWKHAAGAGVSRHPLRVALFRSLLSGGEPGAPLVRLLLCGGVPVAGDVSLVRGAVLYELETAYDDGYRQAGPGNVHQVLTIRDASARGVAEVNLLTNFAYYKARWGAVITATEALQVYRRGSLHQLRARIGALRRRLLGAPRPYLAGDHRNLSRPAPAGAPAQAAPERTAARAEAAAVLGRLAAGGIAVERRPVAALLEGTELAQRRRVA